MTIEDNRHTAIGSSFEEFLEQQGTRKETTRQAEDQ